MSDCPNYCTSHSDRRQFCQLRNGCKADGRLKCPIDHFDTDSRWFMNTFAVELGVYIKSNGTVDYKVRCASCGKESLCLNKTDLSELRWNGLKVSWTKHNQPTERCSVKGCTALTAEYHHFAPRNTFPDAEDWPIMPLCTEHHRIWHRTMDGYRWHSKAPQLNTETKNQLKQEKETA